MQCHTLKVSQTYSRRLSRTNVNNFLSSSELTVPFPGAPSESLLWFSPYSSILTAALLRPLLRVPVCDLAQSNLSKKAPGPDKVVRENWKLTFADGNKNISRIEMVIIYVTYVMYAMCVTALSSPIVDRNSQPLRKVSSLAARGACCMRAVSLSKSL